MSKIQFSRVGKGVLIGVYDDYGLKTKGGIISFAKNGKLRQVSYSEEVEILTAADFARKFNKKISWANAAIETLRSKL